MRRPSLATLALILLGCPTPAEPEPTAIEAAPAGPSAGAPAPTPAPAQPPVEPVDPAPALAPTEPVEPPVVIPTAPLLASGLPAVSRGKAIVLESLPTAKREVAGSMITSVDLADLEARAELDRLIEKENGYGPCKVMLALPTFVSVRCYEAYVDTGMEHRDHHNTHFVIDGSAIRKVEWEELLHPGLPEQQLFNLLLHDAKASERRAVFTNRGLELSYPFDGEPADIDRIPWRVLGPYLRADSVLAPLLAAEGIGFAPVGTTLSLPASAPGLAPKFGAGGSAKHLLQLWLLAPEPVRALARLATPGGLKPFILVFSPSSDPVAIAELAARGPTELDMTFSPIESYSTDQIATVMLVRTLAPVELRDKPGKSDPVTATVPEATEVATIDGLLERSDSAPGTSGWVYVVTREGLDGWTRAKELERVEVAAAP